MTQIIPSDFDIAAEDSTEFVPMRGVANPHLQTMRTGNGLTCQTVTFWISPGAKRLNRLAISRVWWFSTVWKAACTARMRMG